jgi:putative flippase GtrA
MVRFAAVSSAGGLVDYIAAAVLIYVGVPDFVALAIGIALAGALSFVGHEIWTFETAGSGRPHGRALRWTLMVALTLVLRWLILRGAMALAPDDAFAHLVALAVAFLASSAAQYLVSRFLVFTQLP